MHSLLEQYLQDIARRLKPLPPARREEELREIRAHLEKVFAARLETASPEDGAAVMALQQFGAPQPLGRKILWTWRRERLLAWKGFWGAAVLALLLTYIPNVPGMVDHLALPLLLPLPHGWELQTHLPIPDWRFQLDTVLVLLPSYLLCGAICGLVFPKRGAAGTALTEGWLLWLFVSSNLGFLAGKFASQPLIAFLYLVQWALCPLTAIFGAWIGSRVVRRNTHAQHA